MTIFICGDSTAASYTPDRAPLTGWGQALADMLPDIPVVNAAMAGRSTKSFLSEGRLIPVEEQLQPGDLIGFYEGITHVGMYVGNGMIIHASTYGVPVQVVPIEQGGPYMGAVRY